MRGFVVQTSLRDDLIELWRHRELLLILVQRDLKGRYKNSVLGFGWSLLNPLMQVLTITFVIKFMMVGKQTPNYHAYVFCAMLPWLFFNTAIMDASPSLLFYYNLIRRTYFPRELVPLAAITANLIHFLLATAVFVAYMTLLPLFWWACTGQLDWPLQPTILLLPIPILGLTLLTVGMGLFISIWTLHFEDMRFIADSLLKIIYWLMPVFYFPEIIRERLPGWQGDALYVIYMLNPLASLLTAFRKLALKPALMPGSSHLTRAMGPEEWGYLALALITSVLIAVAGHRYFAARKWSLAERE